MVFKVRQMTDAELSVSNPHLVFCFFTVARFYIGASLSENPLFNLPLTDSSLRKNGQCRRAKRRPVNGIRSPLFGQEMALGPTVRERDTHSHLGAPIPHFGILATSPLLRPAVLHLEHQRRSAGLVGEWIPLNARDGGLKPRIDSISRNAMTSKTILSPKSVALTRS